MTECSTSQQHLEQQSDSNFVHGRREEKNMIFSPQTLDDQAEHSLALELHVYRHPCRSLCLSVEQRGEGRSQVGSTLSETQMLRQLLKRFQGLTCLPLSLRSSLLVSVRPHWNVSISKFLFRVPHFICSHPSTSDPIESSKLDSQLLDEVSEKILPNLPRW